MEIDSTQILNEIEKDKIIAFNSDRIMFEAVKKYLLAYLYKHGVITPGVPHQSNINWALGLGFSAITPVNAGGTSVTNEELGADLRATAKGIQVIESGFQELAEFKRPVVTDEKTDNPAL